MLRVTDRVGSRCTGVVLSVLSVACRPPSPSPPPTASPLRVGLYAAPAGLDPHRRNDFVTFSVASNVFEGLVALDQYLHISPALAESWTSPDDRTWRFRLRRGVLFHDGRPLTADDIVFSLERARRHPRSEFASYLVTVREARVLDASTVEIVTERPDAVLLHRLAFVLVVPRGSPPEIAEAVGTGPYRASSWRPGEPIVLRAFDRHWAGRPAEDEVHLKVLRGRGDRTRRLLAGDVDVLLELAPDDVPAVRSAPGFRVVSQPGPAVDVLAMRLDAPPFSDPRVRRAVHLALDRDALVARLLQGEGEPASQLVSRNVFGFDPEIEPLARDLGGARRLLAAAGHPKGLDVTLEFRLDWRADEIARQLGEAGIRVRLQSVPLNALLARVAARSANFSYVGFVSDSGEASDVLESSLHTRDDVRGFGASNYRGYSNAELDALIESSERMSHMEDRRQMLQSCMRLVMKDLPIIPLVERNLIYGFRDGIAWEPRVDGRVLACDLRRIPRGK